MPVKLVLTSSSRNKNCFPQIIQTVQAEELPAWVSPATTEEIYQGASNMEINDRIRFIVIEEIYKSVKTSDSGKIFRLLVKILILLQRFRHKSYLNVIP